MLKWCRQPLPGEVPFRVPFEHVETCGPEAWAAASGIYPARMKGGKLASLGKPGIAGGPGIAKMVQIAFRRTLDSDEQAPVVEQAFSGFRKLNELTQQLEQMQTERAGRQKIAASIKFPVGTVVHHKNFDYRGAIVGWEAQCTRGDPWLIKNDLTVERGNQPFYFVIPDSQDCVRQFGAPRVNKYVAQDNLTVQHTAAGRCCHKMLLHIPLPLWWVVFDRTGERFSGDS